MSTADQRRAKSDEQATAIESALEGMNMEGMLGDWITIGCTVKVDDDGDPTAQYFILFSGGSMITHQALGLIAKGQAMMTQGELTDEE